MVRLRLSAEKTPLPCLQEKEEAVLRGREKEEENE